MQIKTKFWKKQPVAFSLTSADLFTNTGMRSTLY